MKEYGFLEGYPEERNQTELTEEECDYILSQLNPCAVKLFEEIRKMKEKYMNK